MRANTAVVVSVPVAGLWIYEKAVNNKIGKNNHLRFLIYARIGSCDIYSIRIMYFTVMSTVAVVTINACVFNI